MINGAHTIIHSHDAEADRAFFREVLDYPYVDAGADWLISSFLPPRSPCTPPKAPLRMSST